MIEDIFGKLMIFLNNLERAGITYTLAHYRDEAIMVMIAVPGERWEVEFLTDGSIEVEKFVSDGEIFGEEAIDELFAKYSDEKQESYQLNLSPEVELTTINR
jgi:hypothetical protein